MRIVGDTPLVRLPRLSAELGARVLVKLELYNPTGSIKDRPATYIIERALDRGLIRSGSLVVESSSGNFGVALAHVCRHYGLRLACVIDPNVTPVHRYMLAQLGAELHMVHTRDASGGYLEHRLQRVAQILAGCPGAFWTNQYANEWNCEAHYHGTGREIFEQTAGRVDYLFVAVSSAGTITGCSRFLRERCPGLEVVAVDAEGSAIFGSPPRPRHIPGLGSSRVPENLDRSLIDSVVHVPEENTILECRRLLGDEGVFAGGSSGTVTAAIRSFFKGRTLPRGRDLHVVAVFPDRGERYFQTLYSDPWVEERYPALLGSTGLDDGSREIATPARGRPSREMGECETVPLHLQSPAG